MGHKRLCASTRGSVRVRTGLENLEAKPRLARHHGDSRAHMIWNDKDRRRTSVESMRKHYVTIFVREVVVSFHDLEVTDSHVHIGITCILGLGEGDGMSQGAKGLSVEVIMVLDSLASQMRVDLGLEQELHSFDVVGHHRPLHSTRKGSGRDLASSDRHGLEDLKDLIVFLRTKDYDLSSEELLANAIILL
jgi:hypothetical protein